MDRRRFISRMGQFTVASGVAASATTAATERVASAESADAAEPLPSIALGSHRISRLIAGSNPLNGYSYLGPHMDRHMREYFTPDRVVEFLMACEQAGITAHQFSYTPTGDARQILDKARERGSQLKVFCLARNREEVQLAKAETDPIAVVHHGGVTDRKFAEGKSAEVRDFVKAAHDTGLLAGVSAHNPDCIRQIADEGWEVDFFMTCFYFLTRKTCHAPGETPPEPETLHLTYPFYRRDPDAMTQVIQQVDQPCLGFKILGAGRLCGNQATVREAFRYAFANIKPTDGVIVGMYPRFFDEIRANATYALEYGQTV
jgi:hypothetical protein